MGISIECTAAEFLQGSHRQKLALPRHSTKQTKHVLWGTLSKTCSVRISRGGIKLRPIVAKAVVSLSNESKPSLPTAVNKVIHFYRLPLLQESAAAELLKSVQTKVSNQIIGLKTEQCFNIGVDGVLSNKKLSELKWILGETYEPENLGTVSFLEKEREENSAVVIEVGPRLSFTTAWSTNAVSICRACGLNETNRLERSRRYLLYLTPGSSLPEDKVTEFAALVHDRMTECVYSEKLASFETSLVPEEVRFIPVMERGREALEQINEEMGLAFDEQDLQYYTKLFMEDIKRNPLTWSCSISLSLTANTADIGFSPARLS